MPVPIVGYTGASQPNRSAQRQQTKDAVPNFEISKPRNHYINFTSHRKKKKSHLLFTCLSKISRHKE
uniref:Uncharacterized protein n=1 Tax=Rhizophora mucronata TaxID=61149 RepID=A0A2P2N5H6_RHIMU